MAAMSDYRVLDGGLATELMTAQHFKIAVSTCNLLEQTVKVGLAGWWNLRILIISVNYVT